MLGTPFLLYIYIYIYIYPKIQPGITSIAVSFTQDAYKRNEAQRMPFGFRCLALLSTHTSFRSVGRIKIIFHKL